MNIGQKIKELLRDNRRTKKDLADHLSKSRNTLDQYINGDTSPTYDTIISIAEFFKVPVKSFFEEDLTNILEGKTRYGYANSSNKVVSDYIEVLKTQLIEKENELKFLRKIINEKLNL